jgi:hypothetical protein
LAVAVLALVGAAVVLLIAGQYVAGGLVAFAAVVPALGLLRFVRSLTKSPPAAIPYFVDEQRFY